MAPPVHPKPVRGVCGIHVDPPCELPARLFPSGWRCTPPDTRRDHQLIPAQTSPEEARR